MFDIERINRKAQKAKQKGDYDRFWKLRRRYLLKQAERYVVRRHLCAICDTAPATGDDGLCDGCRTHKIAQRVGFKPPEAGVLKRRPREDQREP